MTKKEYRTLKNELLRLGYIALSGTITEAERARLKELQAKIDAYRLTHHVPTK